MDDDRRDFDSDNMDSSTKKAREIMETRRLRSSFSFDPMAISPLFEGMQFFLDIDCEDADFREEVQRLIEKLGGKLMKTLVEEKGTIVVWRHGDYDTLVKAQESNIPAISQRWIFSCVQNNEKQPFEGFLVSAKDREDAKLRKELGIKKLGKTKRPSNPAKSKVKNKRESRMDENKLKSRASSRVEAASKKGGIEGALMTMADTLKEICEGDSDLQDLLDSEVTDYIRDSAKSTSAKRPTKRLDRNPKTVKKPEANSEKKQGKPIQLSNFFSCLQKQSAVMVVYQYPFVELKEFLKMKTENGKQVNYMAADKFHFVSDKIDYFVVSPECPPTLGLLYAILKQVSIVGVDFVKACRKQGCVLSLDGRWSYLLNRSYDTLNPHVFDSLTAAIFSPKSTQTENQVKMWTVTRAVERFGGRLTDLIGLTDVLIVLQDDIAAFQASKAGSVYKDHYVPVVNESWIVDSVFSGRRKPYLEDSYGVPIVPQASNKVNKHLEKKPSTSVLVRK